MESYCLNIFCMWAFWATLQGVCFLRFLMSIRALLSSSVWMMDSLKKKKKIKIPCYWNSIHDISPNISVTNDEVFGSYKGFRWNLFSPYPHLEARWRGVSPLLFWAFISIQVLTLSANSKAFTHYQNTSKCICHWVTKLSTCHFALQSPSFHMSKSALQVNIVIIK